MSHEDLLERLYWSFVILSNLAYAALNLQAYKTFRAYYLLWMMWLSLSVAITSSIMFLLRFSEIHPVNVHLIRDILFVIPIVRIPLEVLLYRQLLKSLTERVAGNREKLDER